MQSWKVNLSPAIFHGIFQKHNFFILEYCCGIENSTISYFQILNIYLKNVEVWGFGVLTQDPITRELTALPQNPELEKCFVHFSQFFY